MNSEHGALWLDMCRLGEGRSKAIWWAVNSAIVDARSRNGCTSTQNGKTVRYLWVVVRNRGSRLRPAKKTVPASRALSCAAATLKVWRTGAAKIFDRLSARCSITPVVHHHWQTIFACVSVLVLMKSSHYSSHVARLATGVHLTAPQPGRMPVPGAPAQGVLDI